MICNRCQCQIYDGANFCPNCGTQFNPQVMRPYQQPYPQQNYNMPVDGNDKSQKAIFTLGLIAFSISFFWAGYQFLIRMMGFRYFEMVSGFIKPLSVITSVLILFLCFIYTKKQGNKTVLLILFIVGLLVQIVLTYMWQYWGTFN